MKVRDQIIQFLFIESLVEGGHGSQPLDDCFADLGVSGWSSTGKLLGGEQVFQPRWLLLQVGSGPLMTKSAVQVE